MEGGTKDSTKILLVENVELKQSFATKDFVA